jgi:16S rRNA (cytosine1402-N4)-methyltransferase
MNMTMSAVSHIPVLLEETIEALNVQPGGRYIDATIGPGGHAAAIMEHSTPGGQLLGIDADPKAIKMARARLDAYGDSVLLVNRNFAELKAICTEHGFSPVHGILFDLGLSSVQLEKNNRGFSFQHDSALDMRLNPHQDITAGTIVNSSPENQLAEIIHSYGEERQSRRIARHIVRQRPINSSLQLAQTIEAAVEHLESALKQAVDLLGFGGRLVVISYHSLEDRIVKQFMLKQAGEASLRLINKKVITPSLAEVHYNPRSRSAKLRAAERISMPKENNSG